MTGDRYIIRWCAERRCWSVFLTGEFARFVGDFPTLFDAERYVCDDEDGAA